MTTGPATPSQAVDAPLRSALYTGPRPPRPSGLSASLVFGWRVLLKIKHMPEQLVEAAVVPVVFTLMFTYLFGGAMANSTGEYLQFILPGTLVMGVLGVTTYIGIRMNIDISTGIYDRFRSLSSWRPAPLVGALLGEAGRYLLAAALVIVLGLVIGFRPAGGVAGVLAAVGLILVFALSLSWVWIALGLVIRTPNAIKSADMMVLFPLTLVSNVFVDPRTMPGWLQAFVNVNPVSHLATAERGLMHGTATPGQVAWVLTAAAVITAVFAPLAMYLYRTKQ